ncbi:HlyD family secretion protein [Salinicola avicenniae]|uniref:HlyD family secretion protein n=1 Tax=Salinicola avicenniae TaxID=2916836 RepID=UPI0020732AD7|nr:MULTISPECIES: HlyD family secretion protein [unclassified Salinicola]
METLIVLTYAAICIAVFKLFRIPQNKWTVPTAILGGVVLLAALVLVMNYNHPFTRQVRQAYTVTPLVSEVRARVVSVDVAPNSRVEAGTPLFTLDSARYEARVARLSAELADALRNSQGRVASVGEAQAALVAAVAQRDQAQRTYDRYQGAASAFSRQQLDQARERLETSQAGVGQAQAALERARAEQETADGAVDPVVAAKQAELEEAQLDLANTVIRAPTDGYLTQLAVRPGMMAVPLPLRPLGVFLHAQSGTFTAAFRQQSLARIEKGAAAELVFDALPGKIFQAEVIEVLPAIAESQLIAGDRLVGSEAFTDMDSRALVTLALQPGETLPHLPLGLSGQAAVYSEHVHHIAVMRRILLRMLSWQHYLYLDH